jgi:hypothetical protein
LVFPHLKKEARPVLAKPPVSKDTELNTTVNFIVDRVKQWRMRRTMMLHKKEDAEVDWSNELLKTSPTFT